MNQIHIARDGQKFGPFTLDQARDYVADGQLLATDMAWFEGATDWMPLHSVPGLARTPPPPPRSRPPPPPAPLGGQPAPFHTSPVATPTQPKPKRNPFVVGCAAIAGGFGLLLLIGSLGVLFQSPEERAKSEEKDIRYDAYYTATVFAHQQFPSIKSIEPYKGTFIEKEGNTYTVDLVIEGVNAFNAPVKQVIAFELEWGGGKWRLKSTKRL